ncbi:MAG: hypothetical protein U1E26_01455 [Coriobacteriia bacterium]|nr:hypothetical protein [Coriobacteriia bacterium]
MDERTRVGMPRAGLLRASATHDPVFWIALAISMLCAAVQIAFAVVFVPVMLFAYGEAGTELPQLFAMADTLGPAGIIVLLGVIDALIFAVFVGASRRYWLGLLFVPPLLYMLGAFVLLITGFSGAETVFLR